MADSLATVWQKVFIIGNSKFAFHCFQFPFQKSILQIGLLAFVFLKYHSLWARCILIRPGQPKQPAPPGCPFNQGPLSASGSWACHQSFNPSFYQFSKGSIATWFSSIWGWIRYEPSQAHACGENSVPKTGMSLNLTSKPVNALATTHNSLEERAFEWGTCPPEV